MHSIRCLCLTLLSTCQIGRSLHLFHILGMLFRSTSPLSHATTSLWVHICSIRSNAISGSLHHGHDSKPPGVHIPSISCDHVHGRPSTFPACSFPRRTCIHPLIGCNLRSLPMRCSHHNFLQPCLIHQPWPSFSLVFQSTIGWVVVQFS